MIRGKQNIYWTKDDEKLYQAVEKNNVERVCDLLSRKKILCSKVNSAKGLSSFHLAIREGHSVIVDKFLDQKPFPGINVKDNQGQTPVHHAAKKARYSILLRLLKNNPNLTLIDDSGKGVLHHACEGGHLNCVQLLISAQAPIDPKDKDGKTPLSYAAEKGQASICRMLIESGANVNELDQASRTPLILASLNRHASVCSYLISKGARVDLIDLKGHNALWHATWNMDKETARVLSGASNFNTPSKTQSFNEKDMMEDDHYEDMGTVKFKEPFASTPCINEKGKLNSIENNTKLPPFQGKTSSLVHLNQADEQFATQNKSDVSKNNKEKFDTINGSEPDKKLNIDSFKELLDNTFHKPREDEDKIQVEDTWKTPHNSVRTASETEYLSPSQHNFNAEDETDSPSKIQNTNPSHHSIDSSNTSETLSGNHFTQLHNQQLLQKSQGETDTYNSYHESSPSFKYIQSYQVDTESDYTNSKENSQNNTLADKKYSINNELVDGNNNRISTDLNDEKNFILKEKLNLLEKMKVSNEKRQRLEEEKKELLRKLHVASVSREWTLHELRCMKEVVECMSHELEKSNDNQNDSIEKKIDEVKFEEYLCDLNSRIDELLKLHEDQQKEEINKKTDGEEEITPEYEEHLNKKVISLVKEKNLLALKLKDILKEKAEMSEKLKDVGKVISNAVELKTENELLIEDYEHFKRAKEEEREEMDELVKLLKETLDSNKTLKFENEQLTEKFNKKVENENDLEETKKENLKLFYEKVQLEDVVKTQKDTIEEMKKGFDETDQPVVQKQEVLTMATKAEDNYKELYDEMVAKMNLTEKALEDYKKKLHDSEQLLERHEREVEDLKLEIENKNVEVKKLKDEIEKMNDDLKLAFENYKKSASNVEKKNEELVSTLRSENQHLNIIVENLKKTLEDKEISYQLLNSNLNLEKRRKDQLEEFKKKILEISYKLNNGDKSFVENSKIFIQLTSLVDNATKLKEENSKIKNELYELESKSDLEKEKFKDLKGLNESLQVEIASLKRTISEQSAYLAILSPPSEISQPQEKHIPNLIKHSEPEIRKFDVSTKSTSPIFKESNNSEIKGLNKTINKQRFAIEKLNNEILVLSSQIECLEQNEKDLQKELLTSMQKKEDEIENIEEKISQLSKEKWELENKNEELNEKCNKKISELNNAKENEEYIKKLIEEYNKLNEVNDKEYEKEESLVSMLKWLRNQHTLPQNLARENEVLKQEIGKLNDKISKLEKDKEELKLHKETTPNVIDILSTLKKEHQKYKELETEVTEINNNENELQEKLKNILLKLNEQKEHLEALKKDPNCDLNTLLSADSTLKDYENEKLKFEDQIQNLKDQNTDLKRCFGLEKEKLENLLNEAGKELVIAQDKLEEVKKELQNDNEESVDGNVDSDRDIFFEANTKASSVRTFPESQSLIEDYEKSISSLQKTCNELEEMNTDFSRKYDNLLKINNDLNAKYRNNNQLLNELNVKNVKINQLEEEVVKTKEKLNRLEEDKKSLLLQKEKSDVIMRIEKLKNLSDKPSENNFVPKNHFKPIPVECVESNVDDETNRVSETLFREKKENRRIFHSILGLYFCLRKKFVINNKESSKMNGHVSTEQEIESHNPINGCSNDEDLINVLSNKCLETYSVLVELEERSDEVSTNTLAASEYITELKNNFETFKDILECLQRIMQAVLEGSLEKEKAVEMLEQPIEGLRGVKMKSNFVFKTATPLGYKSKEKPKIRIIKGSESELDDSLETSSPNKLIALQNQLKENERRYREVISSYRRHLLSAVQGDMDPGIKKALMNIVEECHSN